LHTQTSTYYANAGPLKCAVGKSLVGWAFIVHDWEGWDWSLMPSSTRSVTLDSCTLLSGALAGHGVADCPKLTLFFKCTRRASPQQWPTPGVLMSEPLFMFPYHCQMYAFKPGISARCSSSDHNPVSTLFFFLSERIRNSLMCYATCFMSYKWLKLSVIFHCSCFALSYTLSSLQKNLSGSVSDLRFSSGRVFVSRIQRLCLITLTLTLPRQQLGRHRRESASHTRTHTQMLKATLMPVPIADTHLRS